MAGGKTSNEPDTQLSFAYSRGRITTERRNPAVPISGVERTPVRPEYGSLPRAIPGRFTGESIRQGVWTTALSY